MADKPAIYSALTEVMRGVGAIGKDSKNEMQGWRYRSAEAVITRVHPLFAIHGVVCVPQVIESSTEVRDTAKGGKMNWSVVKVQYTFFAADGSSVTVVAIGEAADSGDKSLGKAQTYAFKVALTTLLAIPVEPEDDPDRHAMEWASELRGGITLAQFNDLKKAWFAAEDRQGKSKERLALDFTEFSCNCAGQRFDVHDWRQWKATDLTACYEAIQPKETTSADRQSASQ